MQGSVPVSACHEALRGRPIGGVGGVITSAVGSLMAVRKIVSRGRKPNTDWT
ncbi:hypothetical protein E2C01_040320 [Portunus trituberculatus]|uniref:Uncharacterized protein n=1 Tax=Portunus trituberculatus TaxID=210409 RepID=A0A5B7FN08_PORTR|nr:hypothetical protein [Portunus trituberculatus]